MRQLNGKVSRRCKCGFVTPPGLDHGVRGRWRRRGRPIGWHASARARSAVRGSGRPSPCRPAAGRPARVPRPGTQGAADRPRCHPNRPPKVLKTATSTSPANGACRGDPHPPGNPLHAPIGRPCEGGPDRAPLPPNAPRTVRTLTLTHDGFAGRTLGQGAASLPPRSAAYCMVGFALSGRRHCEMRPAARTYERPSRCPLAT